MTKASLCDIMHNYKKGVIMATQKASLKTRNAAVKADDETIIPTILTQEQGYLGLRISNRQILEESQKAFRYPHFLLTVHEMRNNPTIGAALNVYRYMILAHDWKVASLPDFTEVEAERARLVETMMHDMDVSWHDFISSVIPYLEYGFAVNEIIPYRRLKRKGSKYNDGLIGIKKLAPRNQETISDWEYNDTGDELIKLYQDPTFITNSLVFQDRLNQHGKLEMDMDKVLLFTAGGTKGNPQGNSILKNVYLAYKQLTLLQENQLVGIAKDSQGLLKIGIPPDYLDPKAPADKQATKAAFETIVDRWNKGTQKGMLVPILFDENNNPMFTYDLMESKGSAKYDSQRVILDYQKDILTALSVDVLRLGSDGSGSFSLAEAKTSILALAIDSRMREIQSVLNAKLMRKIYEMNGWDTERLPTFEYSKQDDLDLETLSSAIQRIFAVGGIEIDREVMNMIRIALGVSPLPEDQEVDVSKLSTSITGKESKSGSGMAVGTTGDGTSKIGGKGGGTDKSVANKANSP